MTQAAAFHAQLTSLCQPAGQTALASGIDPVLAVLQVVDQTLQPRRLRFSGDEMRGFTILANARRVVAVDDVRLPNVAQDATDVRILSEGAMGTDSVPDALRGYVREALGDATEIRLRSLPCEGKQPEADDGLPARDLAQEWGYDLYPEQAPPDADALQKMLDGLPETCHWVAFSEDGETGRNAPEGWELGTEASMKALDVACPRSGEDDTALACLVLRANAPEGRSLLLVRVAQVKALIDTPSEEADVVFQHVQTLVAARTAVAA